MIGLRGNQQVAGKEGRHRQVWGYCKCEHNRLSPSSPVNERSMRLWRTETGKTDSKKAMFKEVVKPNVDGKERWVKKMRKIYFEYKLYTVTDRNDMILAEETTAANENDIKHLDTPLRKARLPEKIPVYVDKSYDFAEKKETLGRMKLKSRIMHKGTRARKLRQGNSASASPSAQLGTG